MSMTAEIVTGDRPPRRAGRPRKKHPSPWRNGRLFVEVTEEHIAKALERDSSHCIIAMAVAEALPHVRHISVDLQSIRFTDPRKKLRLTFLSPHLARDIIVNFDQGLRGLLAPVTFSMKPAIVAASGKKRATPSPEQLRGTGLKLAPEQPHVPSSWQDRHRAASALVVAGTHAGEAAQAEVPPRKRRQPRALVSSVKNGEIPVQLGGRPPPVSILSRREFGMRAIRR
jgi:hypothetical protein